MLAQVIVDVVHENVAHTFTYTVPPAWRSPSASGWRCPSAPVARRVSSSAFSEVSDLPPGASCVPFAAPWRIIPPSCRTCCWLAEWMAENAHCPLAETLRLMLPAEMRGGRVQVKTQPTARSLVAARSVRSRAGSPGTFRKAPCAADAPQGWKASPVAELKLLVRDPKRA